MQRLWQFLQRVTPALWTVIDRFLCCPQFKKYIKDKYLTFIIHRLNPYLHNHNLLDTFQHGFLTGKSVTTAALSFIESIIDSVDRGKKLMSIFIDLSNDFDSVEYLLLIQKLQSLGLTSNAYKWFQSYLTIKWHYVDIQKLTFRNRSCQFKSQFKQINVGILRDPWTTGFLCECYLKNISNHFLFHPPIFSVYMQMTWIWKLNVN